MKTRFLLLSVVLLFTVNVFGQVGQIKILTNGRMGFHTTTPAQAVDFRSGQVHIQYGSNPLQINVAPANARIMANSKVVFFNMANSAHIAVEASSFNTVSDERLKTNIQQLSAGKSPLAIVRSLNGYVYDLKEDVNRGLTTGTPVKHQIGFLAQEVERLIPEAVHTTTDSTELKTMSYNQIIPYLVEAIKEQQVIIEGLNQRIEQMEGATSARRNGETNLEQSIVATEQKK